MVYLNAVDTLLYKAILLFIHIFLVPLWAWDPYMTSIIIGGTLALGLVAMNGHWKTFFMSVLVFSMVSPSMANDRYGPWSQSHAQYRQFPQYDLNKIEMRQPSRTNQFFSGAVKGDVIQKPTLFNIAGQIAGSFTPAAVAFDIRDVLANGIKSMRTGFKEHKKETAMAAGGFVPLLGDMKKIKQMVQLHRINKFRNGIADAVPLVRKTLPRMPDSIRQTFGRLKVQTIPAGTPLYRAPGRMEDVGSPGRLFRAKPFQKGEWHTRSHKLNGLQDNMRYQRVYVTKKPMTLYAGPGKGSGYKQFYIPDDIPVQRALNWRHTKEFMEAGKW